MVEKEEGRRSRRDGGIDVRLHAIQVIPHPTGQNGQWREGSHQLQTRLLPRQIDESGHTTSHQQEVANPSVCNNPQTTCQGKGRENAPQRRHQATTKKSRARPEGRCTTYMMCTALSRSYSGCFASWGMCSGSVTVTRGFRSGVGSRARPCKI